MIYQIITAVLLCVTSFSGVVAWPSAILQEAINLNFNATQADIYANLEKAYSTLKIAPRQVFFDPSNQYVPTTGQYAFRAPNFAAGDQRGNCPGLNSLANHGYIPHNGIATAAQMADANMRVFGMGPGLSNVLSLFAVVMNGDLTKFSIGGPTPLVPGLLGLLGTPQGMSGNSSHNKYEGDSSGTRGDLYLTGDSANLVLPQFKQLFDMQPDPATANYNLGVIIPFHAYRFQHSVQNNPYFFNAPLSGVIFKTAGYNFINAFMANHSAQYPQGILNQEVLKTFFAVSGPRSNFVYTRGGERIPDNWYRRPDYYDFPQASVDILVGGLTYPPLISVGGNLGQVNSFTGVNLGQLTGGLLNSVNLLQGNNLICATFQLMRFATPDLLVGPGGLLTGLLGPVVQALNNLSGLLGQVLAPLGCQQLSTYDKSLFDIFPGSYGV